MPIVRRRWLFPLVVSVALVGCQSAPATPTVPPPTSIGSGGPSASAPSGGSAPSTGDAAAPAPSGGEVAAPPVTSGGDPLPDGTDPTAALPDASGTVGGQASVPGVAVTSDRSFVESMIKELQADLVLLDDAAAKGQHAELKTFVSQTKPRWTAQLTQLKQWRKDWFGLDSAVVASAVNLDMFPEGEDYDWSWADEMTRRMQNGIEIAKATAFGKAPRAEVQQMAQAMQKDWAADRDQLDAWTNAWLQALPTVEDPYAGIDLSAP